MKFYMFNSTEIFFAFLKHSPKFSSLETILRMSKKFLLKNLNMMRIRLFIFVKSKFFFE